MSEKSEKAFAAAREAAGDYVYLAQNTPEPIDTARLRELLEKIPPAPWEQFEYNDDLTPEIGVHDASVNTLVTAEFRDRHDEYNVLDFIAEARNTLPALLDEIERLRVVNDKAMEALREVREACLFVDDDGCIGVDDDTIDAELFNRICDILKETTDD